MRLYWVVLQHELRTLLMAPSSYVAAVLFLIVMIVLYVFALNEVTQADLEDVRVTTLFFQGFLLPVWFMVPLLTMRSIAEERRGGTLETLLTTPVSPLQVVLAKFSAAYLFYLGMWALTLGFPLILEMREPEIARVAQVYDAPSLYGGMAFIALTGTLYVALGLFCSSLTRSQLISGLLTFCLLFFLTMGSWLVEKYELINIQSLQGLQEPAQYLQTFQHLEDFSRGVIDSRPFMLYLSNAALLLGLTTLVVERRA